MEIIKLGDIVKDKYIVIILIVLIMLIIGSVFVMAFTNTDNEEELLNKKLQSEIEFLDTSIVNMLNSVNDLTFQNYSVASKKIQNDTSETTSESSSSSSEQSSEDSKSSKQEQNSSEDEDSNYQYKMEENSTLLKSRTTNWRELAYNIEILNSSWATITLDLYKNNIDAQSILGFNTDLDNTIKAIKDQNKTETLLYLAQLYSYLPTYVQGFTDDITQVNLYNVKNCVYNAYALIEQNNNSEVKKQLEQAEEFLVSIMNDIDTSKNEFDLNKTYILLKDLQTAVDLNDIDIFYVKYKNLYEELDVL